MLLFRVVNAVDPLTQSWRNVTIQIITDVSDIRGCDVQMGQHLSKESGSLGDTEGVGSSQKVDQVCNPKMLDSTLLGVFRPFCNDDDVPSQGFNPVEKIECTALQF